MGHWSIDADGGALVATLQGGGVNSLDEDSLAGFGALLDRVDSDDGTHVLVLTGAGSTFCVGLDLDLLGRAFADHEYFSDVIARLHALLDRLALLPVPVIAAVNGTTRAGGFELMLACDLVLVADEARVADHHLHFGMLPGGGATARLPRLAGPQRAKEILFTAGWLTGPELVAAGLALRCVAGDALLPAALDLATAVGDKPRAVVGRLKAVLAAQDGTSVTEAGRIERAHFRTFLDDEPLAAEGYRAFVENRQPVWRTT